MLFSVKLIYQKLRGREEEKNDKLRLLTTKPLQEWSFLNRDLIKEHRVFLRDTACDLLLFADKASGGRGALGGAEFFCPKG